MRRSKSLFPAALWMLALASAGCTTTQTVHWETDWPAAAVQMETLSSEYGAEVVSTDGERFRARALFVSADTLRLLLDREGAESSLALDRVKEIRISTDGNPGNGAWIGGLIGVGATTALLISDGCQGDYCPIAVPLTVAMGGGAGVGFGALGGLLTKDKVVFVRE